MGSALWNLSLTAVSWDWTGHLSLERMRDTLAWGNWWRGRGGERGGEGREREGGRGEMDGRVG